MSDEPDIDDTVSAMLIKLGSPERTERVLRQSSTIPDDEIQDAVDRAVLKVISSAPPELRASMTAVCSYHRWNLMYQQCMSHGKLVDAMAAQKQLDRLLSSVH